MKTINSIAAHCVSYHSIIQFNKECFIKIYSVAKVINDTLSIFFYCGLLISCLVDAVFIFLSYIARSSYIFMIVAERNKICWNTSSSGLQEVEVLTTSEVSDIWFLYRVVSYYIGTVEILPWNHSRHVGFSDKEHIYLHNNSLMNRNLARSHFYPHMQHKGPHRPDANFQFSKTNKTVNG
jgi:hypothetical protein